MDERIYISLLYDFYFSLLTERQSSIFEFYFFNDYSLNEIAEKLNISKQAVRDSLSKTETILKNYEKKLSLYEKHINRKKIIDSIIKMIDENKTDNIKTELLKLED